MQIISDATTLVYDIVRCLDECGVDRKPMDTRPASCTDGTDDLITAQANMVSEMHQLLSDYNTKKTDEELIDKVLALHMRVLEEDVRIANIVTLNAASNTSDDITDYCLMLLKSRLTRLEDYKHDFAQSDHAKCLDAVVKFYSHRDGRLVKSAVIGIVEIHVN